MPSGVVLTHRCSTERCIAHCDRMLMAALLLGQQPDRMQITAATLIVIAQLIRQDPGSTATEEPLAQQSV